jgi:hypothetical protein
MGINTFNYNSQCRPKNRRGNKLMDTQIFVLIFFLIFKQLLLLLLFIIIILLFCF